MQMLNNAKSWKQLKFDHIKNNYSDLEKRKALRVREENAKGMITTFIHWSGLMQHRLKALKDVVSCVHQPPALKEK